MHIYIERESERKRENMKKCIIAINNKLRTAVASKEKSRDICGPKDPGAST